MSIRNIFKNWANLYNPFKASPTLDEIIANDTEALIKENEELLHAMRVREFQLHMNRAKLDALDAWRKGDSHDSR